MNSCKRIGKRLFSFVICLIVMKSCLPDAYAVHDMTSYFNKYTLTGNGALDLVAVAKEQAGKFGYELGYKKSEVDSKNWCAVFVMNCAKYAGLTDLIPFCDSVKIDKSAVSCKTASGLLKVINKQYKGDIVFANGRLEDSDVDKSIWKTKIGNLSDLQPGDLVGISWKKNGHIGHIEIVTETTSDHVKTIGGNTKEVSTHLSLTRKV